MTLAELTRSLGLEPAMFAPMPATDGRFVLGADPERGWIYMVDTMHPLGSVIVAKWTAQSGEAMQRLWARAVQIVESGIGDMQ